MLLRLVHLLSKHLHTMTNPYVLQINVSLLKVVQVLENYHLACTFKMLKEEDNNIFANCSKEIRNEVRATVVDMVLATDFGRHLELMGQFKSKVAAGGISREQRDDRILYMKMALKCADISHTSKARDLHLKWTDRITEEFFLQV